MRKIIVGVLTKRVTVALVVFGVAFIVSNMTSVYAAQESFTPQTSSTWTDVPSPSVLPAAGVDSVVAIFIGVSVVCSVLHMYMRGSKKNALDGFRGDSAGAHSPYTSSAIRNLTE